MTTPGLGGLQPPPMNAPAAGALVPGVQPGVSGGVVLARYVIVFGTAGGVFVYNGTPADGNPPIFWATSASTDPYGNSIPSTAGVAGTGTFEAGDTIINASGTFVYSSTPGTGNLVQSLAPANGTDAFGNYYLAGAATYGGGFAAVLTGGGLSFFTGTLATGWTQQGELITDSGGDLLSTFPGTTDLTGNLAVAGGTIQVGSATITATNFNMAPAMGIPPNYPLSTTGTDNNSGSTFVSGERAQMNSLWSTPINEIVACLNSLISEMQNRGMIS